MESTARMVADASALPDPSGMPTCGTDWPEGPAPKYDTAEAVDEALSAAKARYDHGDAPYDPDVLALIRAAETMHAKLYGPGSDTSDWDTAVDWLLNSRHTADPDIQTEFWAIADGLATCDEVENLLPSELRERRKAAAKNDPTLPDND